MLSNKKITNGKYFTWRIFSFSNVRKILVIPHCDYCNRYDDKTGDHILKTISKYQGRTSIMAIK